MDRLPLAHIVHRLQGRVRLRVREKCQDLEYFEEVRERLGELSEIADIKINGTTGSILLQHPETPYSELEALLDDLQLFELTTAPEPAPSALSPVLSGLSGVNQALSHGSAGSVDLRALAFLAVMGLVIRQVLRGQLIGPALPMIVMALNLLKGVGDSTPDADS
jgi:hypothetical protein